ncbi:MAG: hypothetical protein H7141_05415 [Burkholderiales bacterium]|nr:hypothetical protein [Bacteroidia bacterium]
MKIIILILVMTISLNGKAQSINNILDNFKKEINPESNSQKVTIVNLKESSYN